MASCYHLDTSSLIAIWRSGKELENKFPDDVREVLKRTVQENKTLITINSEVLKELKPINDALYCWVKKNEDRLVKDSTTAWRCQGELIKKYKESSWLRKRTTRPVWADPWIIAWAKVNDATVVTGEISKIDPNDRTPENARKIPDICCLEAIPCIGTEQFLRKIGATHRDTA